MSYRLSEIREIAKMVDPACPIYVMTNAETVIEIFGEYCQHVYSKKHYEDFLKHDCDVYIFDGTGKSYSLGFKKAGGSWKQIYVTPMDFE